MFRDFTIRTRLKTEATRSPLLVDGDSTATWKLVQLSADIAERIFLILLAIPFLLAFVRVLPTRPTLILVCASELMGVIFIILRRPAPIQLGRVAIVSAFCGTAFPLLVRPGGIALVPGIVSSVCITAGLAVSVTSKLFLNRSFGLIAANRGVKHGGPYRLVRHPMYLGYFVTELGFLTANLTALNVLIYLIAWTAQIIRITEEEQVLSRDEAYRRFAQRVRYRVIPGIY